MRDDDRWGCSTSSCDLRHDPVDGTDSVPRRRGQNGCPNKGARDGRCTVRPGRHQSCRPRRVHVGEAAADIGEHCADQVDARGVQHAQRLDRTSSTDGQRGHHRRPGAADLVADRRRVGEREPAGQLIGGQESVTGDDRRRVASPGAHRGASGPLVHRAVCHLPEQAERVVHAHGWELDRGPGDVAVRDGRPGGRDESDRLIHEAPGNDGDRCGRLLVRPLQVVQRHQNWVPTCHVDQNIQQGRRHRTRRPMSRFQGSCLRLMGRQGPVSPREEARQEVVDQGERHLVAAVGGTGRRSPEAPTARLVPRVLQQGGRAHPRVAHQEGGRRSTTLGGLHGQIEGCQLGDSPDDHAFSLRGAAGARQGRQSRVDPRSSPDAPAHPSAHHGE